MVTMHLLYDIKDGNAERACYESKRRRKDL